MCASSAIKRNHLGAITTAPTAVLHATKTLKRTGRLPGGPFVFPHAASRGTREVQFPVVVAERGKEFERAPLAIENHRIFFFASKTRESLYKAPCELIATKKKVMMN